LKIVHFAPIFHPRAGGGFKAVYALAKEQFHLSHEVYIFSFRHQMKEPIPYAEFDDVKTLYYDPIIKLSWPKVSFDMISELLNMKPDVVHFHGMMCREQSFLMLLALKICSSRSVTVWTAHGLHEHYETAKKFGLGYLGLITPLTIGMTIVDKVIALSPTDLDILTHMGVPRYKVCIIPNGVDWSYYSNPPPYSELHEVKEKYGLGDNTTALTVCVIRANKGLEYLMKAAHSLEKMKFVIVGEVGDREYFYKLLELRKKLKLNNLKFLGWVPDKDLRLLLFISDIFVLPSLSETLPLVVLEAMAAGKPIVATSVGGIPYLVRNGVNGILVPPRNHLALSSALKELSVNPERMAKMGEANRLLVMRRYTWRNIANKTISLYERLINRLK